MKTYQLFARRLFELLGDHRAVRIRIEGFMPLTVEEIAATTEGYRQISIAHYGEQNGDLMRDPEIVFSLYPWDESFLAQPVYFRNDYAGLEQYVYVLDEHGRRTRMRPALKRELRTFARLWFRNLKSQGFFDRDAVREVLS